MKRILYTILLCTLAIPMSGQEASHFCTQASLKNGVLDFTIELPAGALNNDEILVATPILVTDNGKEELKPMHFVSRGQLPYYRRTMALKDHKTYLREAPYAYAVTSTHQPTSLCYTGGAPSKIKELLIQYEIHDCCNIRTLGEERVELSEDPGANAPFLISKQMISPFIVAKKVTQKIQQENIDAHFHYLFDRDLLMKDFRENNTEIARVRQAMDHLFTDKDMYTILSGEIIGYASPEGAAEHNRDLSLRRAQSVKNYFGDFYPEMKSFVATGKGDNWDGLSKALEASNFGDKAELIRLAMLNDKAGLANHARYPELISKVYPLLRLSILSITYSPRCVTLEEAKQLLFIRPKDLSLEECYGAVEALSKEGKDLMELHQQVIKGHPEDPIARINYSGVALIAGNVDEAFKALRGLEDDKRAMNNLGLAYALKGDYDAARKFFAKSNDTIARENLLKLEGRK